MRFDGLTPVIELDITKPLDKKGVNPIESVSLKGTLLTIRLQPFITIGAIGCGLILVFVVMKK